MEDFKEPVPGLFDALTQVPDAQNRWNITRMPINIDLSHYGPKGHVKVVMRKSPIKLVCDFLPGELKESVILEKFEKNSASSCVLFLKEFGGI